MRRPLFQSHHAAPCVHLVFGSTDFDWGYFGRVIDVGGSKGSKSLAILKRHPHLTALVFDRDQVIQTVATYWIGKETPALLSRLTYQSGNLGVRIKTWTDLC